MKYWKCFFIHTWKYLSNYSRICKYCPKTRPGWGDKLLSPGDDFSKINTGLSNDKAIELNPDNFRKI